MILYSRTSTFVSRQLYRSAAALTIMASTIPGYLILEIILIPYTEQGRQPVRTTLHHATPYYTILLRTVPCYIVV